MHQNSFLNQAKDLILLNFRGAKVNFVREAFECKNCLTFDTGKLLAFAKLRVQIRKQQYLAYTVFAASDVHTLKGIQLPLSLALAFWLKTREVDIPAASSKVK